MTSVTASPALAGRLTARGSDELEARLNAVLGEVAQRVRIAVRQDERVALVLHGGYGRGEGGVERSGGEERLHNNLDLLVVSPGRPTQELRARVDQALAPIARSAGIGIDAGVVAARSITSAPHLVMWHDMHHAHRTLLGDPRFVRSLERFSGPDIEPWDVRNLLSNRATLLLLARSVLDGRPVDDAVARSVIKHVMKAIIGYGDAFLFFNGRYHHLYAVKQARMRAFTGADPELRALYDEAIEFRFEPTYEATRQRHPDLQAWLGHVTRSLAPVHLACERARLARPQLEWDEYLELALGHALLEGPWTARGCARRLSRLTEGGLEPGAALSVWARAGARIADARSRLAIVLPAVLYDLPKASRETAARLLGSISVDRETLCRAYLRTWGRDGDPNFGAVARQLKLRTGQHRTEAA